MMSIGRTIWPDIRADSCISSCILGLVIPWKRCPSALVHDRENYMAPTTEKKRTGPSARKTTTRPNRAQLQAAEIRAAESGAMAAAAPPPTAGTGVNLRGKSATRGFVLSREAEMLYVRQDLRRLLLVSAGLFVLMIALLIILD